MKAGWWTACIALMAAGLLAGCGGGDPSGRGTTPGATAAADAEEEVVAAAERLNASSYRATVEQRISVNTAGAPDEVAEAFQASAGSATSVVEAERGGSRIRVKIEASRGLPPFEIVLHDGDVFVVPEGSDPRRLSGPLADFLADSADIGTDQLAEGLADVRDEGPATVDGRAVRRYSARLSQEGVDAFTKRAFASLGLAGAPVDLELRSSEVTVDLLADGGVAHQRISAVMEIDFTRLLGSEVVVLETADTEVTVRDMGAPITVERPQARGEITDQDELGRYLAGAAAP